MMTPEEQLMLPSSLRSSGSPRYMPIGATAGEWTAGATTLCFCPACWPCLCYYFFVRDKKKQKKKKEEERKGADQ